MREQALQLHEHGTKAFFLPPSAIFAAAERDLRCRQENIEAADGGLGGAPHRYAFTANHVRRAKSAKHLIELAIKEPEKAAKSTKINTRRIYDDADTLRAALKVGEPG